MTQIKNSFSEDDPAKLLLIDDHPLMRRGLKELLELEDDIVVVGEAQNGREGIEFLQQHPNAVDLVILDNNMPEMNGTETLKAIREQQIEVKVLLFTVSDQSEDVRLALYHDVDGYLLKDMDPSELIVNIHQILCGELVISPALAPILARAMRKSHQQESKVHLTERERQVATMIADGLSNKMIGNKLGIVESTVKVHVKNILNKLELRTRVEVAVWAIDQSRTK